MVFKIFISQINMMYKARYVCVVGQMYFINGT